MTKPDRISLAEFEEVRFKRDGDAPYMELFVYDEKEHSRRHIILVWAVLLFTFLLCLLTLGTWMVPVVIFLGCIAGFYVNSLGVPDGRKWRLRVFIDELQVWEKGELKHAIPWSRLTGFSMGSGLLISDKVRLETDEGVIALRLSSKARKYWLSAVRVLSPSIWDESAPRKYVINNPVAKLVGFGLIAVASAVILSTSEPSSPWLMAAIFLTFLVSASWAAMALVSMSNSVHLAGMSVEEAGHCAHDLTLILPIMDAEAHRYKYADPARIKKFHRFWNSVSWLFRIGGPLVFLAVMLFAPASGDPTILAWFTFVLVVIAVVFFEKIRWDVAAIAKCADAELIIRDREMYLKLNQDSEEFLVESEQAKDGLLTGLRLKGPGRNYYVMP